MSARSSDLVPILTGLGGAGGGMGFRQGTVVEWNPDTAENVILVGTKLIENMPILNTSEASLLVPGDVVGIMTSGSSWAIMGRLVIPGTPEAATSIQAITNRIQAAEDVTEGSRDSTSYGDLTGADVGPAVTLRIGASGRALCFWSCEMGQTGNWQSKLTPHVGVAVSGATTRAPNNGNALNLALEYPSSPNPGNALSSTWIQCAMMHLFTGLNPGDTTFTMKYKHDGVVPAGPVDFQSREIAVFAL